MKENLVGEISKKIKVRTATRIDLAGGTIDLWPIHQVLDVPATTMNLSITLHACTELTIASEGPDLIKICSRDQHLEFQGSRQDLESDDSLPLFRGVITELLPDFRGTLEIVTHATSPAGAGLGGSSSIVVGLVAAIQRSLGKHPSQAELVRIAADIEARLIHSPTGTQDYWGALLGGVNRLDFPAGTTQVTSIDSDIVEQIDQQLLVVYSGQSRHSAINNWEIFKLVFDGDRSTIARLSEIAKLAGECADAASRGDVQQMLALSKKEWELRVALWPDIETERTRSIATAAVSAGASFARVCGAGGGGVVAVFAKDRDSVSQACTEAGGTVLDASICSGGLVVEESN